MGRWMRSVCGVLVLLLVLPALPGCIGVTVLYPGGFDEVHENLVIRESTAATFKAGLDPQEKVLRAAGLRGVPDSIRKVAPGDHQYTYRGKIAWVGVIIHVLIPVPLVVPIGRDHYTITIRDETVLVAQNASWTRGSFSGYGFTFDTLEKTGWSWGRETLKRPRLRLIEPSDSDDLPAPLPNPGEP